MLVSWKKTKRLLEKQREQVPFQVGDKIMLKVHVKSSLEEGVTKSLSDRREGPGVAFLTPNTLLVKIGLGDDEVRRINVSEINRYFESREKRD